jgi:rhamnosyl/mannosyltransferase
MMRVLHIGKFDTFGGIERHLRLLAGGLHASGEAEVVVALCNDRAVTDEHLRDGYRTVRVASWGQVASVAVAPTFPLLVRRLHAERPFDLVHLHFPDPLGHLASLTLPANVIRVATWHSDIVRQKTAYTLYRPLQQRFLARAAAVIAATPAHFSSSSQLPDLGQRAHVIPYGFDPSQLPDTPAAQDRLGALHEERAGRAAIFSLGRHVYYKGFEVLLRAMQSVEALLWLGGDGPLRPELQQLSIALGVQSKVRFVGAIPDSELRAYYAACDVYCMPSVARSEAFGLVQLEAMYMQRPVVSCALGNGVDWVNQNGCTGLTVPPSNVDALAGALRKLLTDTSLREAMGKAGSKRVAEVFAAKSMVENTLSLYNALLTR